MTLAGIQISSVRKYLQTPPDVQASFRKVRATGYRAIQIQWINPEISREFIRDVLRETGMDCVGTQDYTDEVLSHLDDFIAMNELWGGRYLCMSGIPDQYRSEAGCEAFAKGLDELTKRLQDHGLILNFHPRASDVLWFGKRNSLDILFEQTRPPFQFLLDVYQVVKAGLNPVEWIWRVQGRNDLVHFKDRRVSLDGSEVLMPVGQGDIDWKPIIRACNDSGVKYAFAEQESWLKDPFECLGESLEYMIHQGITNS